jgi:hypothetical protein
MPAVRARQQERIKLPLERPSRVPGERLRKLGGVDRFNGKQQSAGRPT